MIRSEGIEPHRILRVQFDELPPLRDLTAPLLAILAWYENRILGETFNEAARAKRPAYVFLDEVQNLAEWAPQLKAIVDHHTLRVVVTGSSALRIEEGRDSLAGRITTLRFWRESSDRPAAMPARRPARQCLSRRSGNR